MHIRFTKPMIALACLLFNAGCENGVQYNWVDESLESVIINNDEKIILGILETKALLKLKKFFFFEKKYKAIALTQDEIEVAIGIIINPIFLKNKILIIRFNITDTKDI